MILEQLRRNIDQIDEKIIDLLAKRFAEVKKIAAYKHMKTIPSLDTERWVKILASVKASAKKK